MDNCVEDFHGKNVAFVVPRVLGIFPLLLTQLWEFCLHELTPPPWGICNFLKTK